jgi:peptidoglycan/xylan/chitin deacetylase (PgdA/CDA1 family)
LVTPARRPDGPFRVALTFDVEHPEGATSVDATERILDTLGETGIAATMFVQGRWARAWPATARRIAEAGHLVGHHSHHHARFAYLTRAGIRHDLAAGEAVIRETTGVNPRPWFRLPFGSGAGMRSVHAALHASGYRHVGWDVDPRDWASGPPAGVRDLVVRGATGHGDGVVILLHGWPLRTAETLPGLVRELCDRGASFVRLDSLADYAGWAREATGRR